MRDVEGGGGVTLFGVVFENHQMSVKRRRHDAAATAMAISFRDEEVLGRSGDWDLGRSSPGGLGGATSEAGISPCGALEINTKERIRKEQYVGTGRNVARGITPPASR